MTSVPPPNTPSKANNANSQPINGGFHINIADFDDLSVSWSSFPSIHFGRSGSPGSSGADDSTSSDEEDEFAGLFKSGKSRSGSKNSNSSSPTRIMPDVTKTLYIQMVNN